MDHLYAPWRHAWIVGAAAGESGGGGPSPPPCLFCTVHAEHERDEAHLVVARGQACLVMLNRYPYNGGHLLVAPARHAPSLVALPAGVRAEMMEWAARGAAALGALYAPHGYNIGINEGRAAGAGIPDHVHLHVVPRWSGDTNFFTAVGETRVVSQDLTVVRTEVAQELARLAGPTP